ncbi:FolM Alternative dihydrofolate reductase 1 [hydrothermal vent metagenome]|uniref:FolM Alternative dihydrofolate reductase 1 n=1 Tax=hydrothermal vent metagenome TaxID=652676 RepID=A0A3B1CCP5_9ZZZZ
MTNIVKPVALITGAARRLGSAISHKLAENGYRIAIHYRDSAEEAFSLAERLNTACGEGSAITFQADLLNRESVINLPELVHNAFGRLDLLVNSASIFEKTDISKVTQSSIALFHDIHVVTPALLSIASAKWLKISQPGRIVNMVDVYADFAKKGYLPYTISKAGLKALTRQLAAELAPDILVNAIAPGAILEPSANTGESSEAIIKKIPMRRFGSPGDIARTVLFLAETEYITGQTIVVDGGRSLGI